jgi:hypothetical protein
MNQQRIRCAVCIAIMSIAAIASAPAANAGLIFGFAASGGPLAPGNAPTISSMGAIYQALGVHFAPGSGHQTVPSLDPAPVSAHLLGTISSPLQTPPGFWFGSASVLLPYLINTPGQAATNHAHAPLPNTSPSPADENHSTTHGSYTTGSYIVVDDGDGYFIPEPSTLVLSLIGWVALLTLRSRRTKQS